MLSVKPWKPDAVIRFVMGVFICIFAGSLVMTALEHGSTKHPVIFYILGASSLSFLGAALVAIRRPWKLENFMQRVWVLLVLFYIGLLLGAFAQKYTGPPGSPVPSVAQLVVNSLSFQGATLALAVFFLREHQVSWNEAFGFSNNWRRSVMLGAMCACIFLPIGWALQQISVQVLTHIPHWNIKPEEQVPVQTLKLATSWADRLVLGIVTILLAPAAEELLFRGVLYPWIRQAGFPKLALFGTALLFGAMHLNAQAFIPLFTLAVILALLYERTNNLLVSMTAHSLFNGFNFALLYLLEKQASRVPY